MSITLSQKNAVVQLSWPTGTWELVDRYEIERKLSFDGDWTPIGYVPTAHETPNILDIYDANMFWDTLPNNTYSNKEISYRVRKVVYASGDPTSFTINSIGEWDESSIRVGTVTVPAPSSYIENRPVVAPQSRLWLISNSSARGSISGDNSYHSLQGTWGFNTFNEIYQNTFGDEFAYEFANSDKLNYLVARPFGSRLKPDEAGAMGLTAGRRATGSSIAQTETSLTHPWERNASGDYQGIAGTGLFADFVSSTKSYIENSGKTIYTYGVVPTMVSTQTTEAIFGWPHLGPYLEAGVGFMFDTLSLTTTIDSFTNIESPSKKMMDEAQERGIPMFGEPGGIADSILDNGWIDYPNYHTIQKEDLIKNTSGVVFDYPEKVFVFWLDEGNIVSGQLPNNGAGMTAFEKVTMRADQIFNAYPANVHAAIGLHTYFDEESTTGVLNQLLVSGALTDSSPLRSAFNINYNNSLLAWDEGSGFLSRDLYFYNDSNQYLIEDYSSTGIHDNILGSYLTNGTYQFEVWSKGPQGNVRNHPESIIFNNTLRVNDTSSRITNTNSANITTSTTKGSAGLGTNVSKSSNNLRSNVNFKVRDTESPKGSVLNLKTNTYISETDRTNVTYPVDDGNDKTELAYREPTRVRVSGIS